MIPSVRLHHVPVFIRQVISGSVSGKKPGFRQGNTEIKDSSRMKNAENSTEPFFYMAYRFQVVAVGVTFKNGIHYRDQK